MELYWFVDIREIESLEGINVLCEPMYLALKHCKAS